jgi:hypothetical protein
MTRGYDLHHQSLDAARDGVTHSRDGLRIASYKKPRSIDVVQRVPRLFNGKIDKFARTVLARPRPAGVLNTDSA